MTDSGFVTSPEQRSRQASVHQRQADDGLVPQPLETPFVPEFYAGGGGLYSTGRDYLVFLRMLLNGGSGNGARILRPETIVQMDGNHIGEISAGILKTQMPERRTTSICFPAPRSDGGWATCSIRNPGPMAGARAR